MVAVCMKVYAVHREGVYRHECCGIFRALDHAREVAQVLATGDDYHDFEVYEYEVGKASQRTEGDGRWSNVNEAGTLIETHQHGLK
jgi:hypothetical protein